MGTKRRIERNKKKIKPVTFNIAELFENLREIQKGALTQVMYLKKRIELTEEGEKDQDGLDLIAKYNGYNNTLNTLIQEISERVSELRNIFGHTKSFTDVDEIDSEHDWIREYARGVQDAVNFEQELGDYITKTVYDVIGIHEMTEEDREEVRKIREELDKGVEV